MGGWERGGLIELLLYSYSGWVGGWVGGRRTDLGGFAGGGDVEVTLLRGAHIGMVVEDQGAFAHSGTGIVRVVAGRPSGVFACGKGRVGGWVDEE